MFKQIALIIIPATIYLFISKEIGLIVFWLFLFWFLLNVITSIHFSGKVLKKASPAAICSGLKQAGHPYYQIDLESPVASYIPALKRRPTNTDLFWGLFFYRLFGRINRNNQLLRFVGKSKFLA